MPSTCICFTDHGPVSVPPAGACRRQSLLPALNGRLVPCTYPHPPCRSFASSCHSSSCTSASCLCTEHRHSGQQLSRLLSEHRTSMPGKPLWQRQPTIGHCSGMVQCVSVVPPYTMFFSQWHCRSWGGFATFGLTIQLTRSGVTITSRGVASTQAAWLPPCLPRLAQYK